MYGIEAARNTIIREIRQILAYYGIYVNMRHITLAIDWMTWIGSLTPLTRHGIRRVDESPIKRATFEEVGEVFHQAACGREHDALLGISECIITGTPPKMGSNHTDVILDEVVEKEHAIPYPVEKVWAPSWESNPWDGQDDEEDIYGTKQVDPWADERQPWEKPPMLFAPGPGVPQFGVPQFGVPQFGVPNPPQAYSPVSPAYEPGTPTSPAYDPNSPASPAYDPGSPMSPAYDPNSPMSPAYDPGSPMSPAYDPSSPMSPAYDPDDVVEAYDPYQSNKKRKTYC